MKKTPLKYTAIAAVLCLFTPASVFAAQENLEQMMWELVASSNSVESVEAFIEAYPDSPHISDAQETLAKLKQSDAGQSLEDQIFRSIGAVSYSAPLAFGNERLIGKNLSEIVQTHPEYPPIAGLPDAVWKEKTCQSCHTWTRADLCTQANTYVAMDPQKYREKMHPFGGLLKINLRNWAQNDCQ